MKGDPKRRLQLRIDRALFSDVEKMAKRKKVTLTSVVERLLRLEVGAYKMEQHAARVSKRAKEDAEQI